ncbi:zinc-binding dehydrogenase [Candidatus Bathycorpusculum sp.]|uniref:zinc-dependent alcohol dehydrogenase n=1 Tax=Candidatus Bathycorpusculum sp. TaxID=2994959 RepID=UPI002817106E|nr:zinc-binding dehydrogenase [Candidatus Termitimicrobium sp.]MCL2685038.1 zinc-binding dehydrogenase [Candidatus Termitimicrobium sp.]
MKVAIYRGVNQVQIENVPLPPIKAGRVLVNFVAGSICGTDMHFYRGDWRWMKKGRILGHDACGIRTDTGERVVMVPMVNCGHCYFCLHGLPSYCTRGKFYGLTRDGFFAESKAMLPRSLITMPSNISDEEGAIVEPVALALRVLNYLQPNLGDWVTVVGQGAIGLLMTQIALLKGCRVIAVDLENYRLEFAQKYGADITINAQKENVIQSVRKLTKHGSDFVIEATGNIAAVEQTPFLVRKAGKVALIGESRGRLNLADADEASFFTMYISPIEYPAAVEMIARGLVDVKGLITHRFNLDEFEQALQTANTPSEKPLKVIIAR